MRLPPLLADLLASRQRDLRDAGVDAGALDSLTPLLLASDYAFERLRRQPAQAARVITPPPVLQLDPASASDWPLRLRQFRHAHSLAIIAADLADGSEAGLAATVRHSSWLADHCLQVAATALHQQLALQYGEPRDRQGQTQQLCVFALGKLGGGELNFSSDIDLVFAYAEPGQSDGARALDNEVWFQRLAQRLIQLLGEVAADGFGFRVDMRLRPFGNAGRLVPSFAAMEQYYQRDGRDWERYAWIKARALHGAQAPAWLATLRPFVFRRYLDYTAFEGLRAMKALIEAEVQKRDLADHLKLGPGGIREIEFIVQLQQLIRGGREPALRVPGLLPALTALVEHGHLQPAAASALRGAYGFLRRLENRLQMLRDEQTHSLPDDPGSRARLAYGMGFADWDALAEQLALHRRQVRAEFERVFEARQRQPGPATVSRWQAYWQALEREAEVEPPEELGGRSASALHERLQHLARQVAAAGLSTAARDRLGRVLPALLQAAFAGEQPAPVFERVLRLLHAVLRRPAYLALLDEQPASLRRLIDVFSRSGLLAERVVAHPLLLDDLLDDRVDLAWLPAQQLRTQALAIVERAAEDAEQALLDLNEWRQSIAFRIGLGWLLRRQGAIDTASHLAALAEAVLAAVLELAWGDIRRQHGELPGLEAPAGVAVIGYGSLGGEELGFASDLDLVFLFDGGQGDALSQGPRPLEATRYQQRLVQKLLALLGSLTAAGRLYEADLRLRPDGAKGLLLCSLQRFADYQRAEAWAWEHQALVRARPVAGASRLLTAFAAIRNEVLQRPRQRPEVLAEVARMRARMRAELDRGDAQRFDLKQGEGGLVDLEFLLQALVLAAADAHPELLACGRSDRLIAVAASAGLLTASTAVALTEAHRCLLGRALDCTLDNRPRLLAEDADLQRWRDGVRAGWAEIGLAAG